MDPKQNKSEIEMDKRYTGAAGLVQLATPGPPRSDIEILDDHFKDIKAELQDLGILSGSENNSKVVSLIAAVILGSRSWPEQPSEKQPKPDYLGIQRPSTAMIKAAKKLRMVLDPSTSQSSSAGSRTSDQRAARPDRGENPRRTTKHDHRNGPYDNQPAQSPDLDRGRSSGNRSDPRSDSIETVNAGPTGEQQVHLGTREWFMRVTEAASCACMCEPGKVRSKVCCGYCRRRLAPCCDCVRTCCCNFGPRYALGHSTAMYSKQEGLVVSTNMHSEQTKMVLGITFVLFGLMWLVVLVVSLVLRLSIPEYRDAYGENLALEQNVVYIFVLFLTDVFPGSFRYDTTVAMVVSILVVVAQCVRYVLRRSPDQLQPNTVSVSDRLLSIAPVSAHRFFVSYKWEHPKGSLVEIQGVNTESHNADDRTKLPTEMLGSRGPDPTPGLKQYLSSTAGAEGLARSLARALPNAWVDVMKLPNAASLHASIYTDLKGAMSTIVLMTPGYLGSVNCNFELLCLLRMHADAISRGERSRLTQASRVVVYLPVDGDMPGLKWPEWTDTADIWKKYNRERIKSCLLAMGVSVVETGYDLLRHIHDRMFMGIRGDLVQAPKHSADEYDSDSVASLHAWWSTAGRVRASAKSAVAGTIVPVEMPGGYEAQCCALCPATFSCSGRACPPPKATYAGNLWIAPDGSSRGRMHRVAPGLWFIVSITATLLYGVVHIVWEDRKLNVGWLNGIDPPLLGTALVLLIMSWLLADGAADLNWRYQHSPCMNKILLAGQLQHGSKKGSSSSKVSGVESWGESKSTRQITGSEGTIARIQASHEYVGHHVRYKLRFAFMMGGADEASILVEKDTREKEMNAKQTSGKAGGKSASVPSRQQSTELPMTTEQAMSIVRPAAAVNTCMMLRELDFYAMEYTFHPGSRNWIRNRTSAGSDTDDIDDEQGGAGQASLARSSVRRSGDLDHSTQSPLALLSRDNEATGGSHNGGAASAALASINHAASSGSVQDGAPGESPAAQSPRAVFAHQSGGGGGIGQIRRLDTSAAFVDAVRDEADIKPGVIYCFVISTVAQAEAYLDFIYGRDKAQIVLMVHSSVPREVNRIYDALYVGYDTDKRSDQEKLPQDSVKSCISYMCWRFGPSVCYSQCPSCCPSCFCGCCCWLGMCCGFCGYSRDSEFKSEDRCCNGRWRCCGGLPSSRVPPQNQDLAQNLLEALSSKVASALHPG